MRWLVILLVVVVVATIFAVIDCAMMAKERVRGLSKPVWLIVIVLLPVLGLILWFTIGRARVTQVVRPRLAPDDDPAFIGTLGRDKEQDERIRRLEEELAALDSDAAEPDEPGKAKPTPDKHPDAKQEPDDTGRADA
ncbi:PLD nuclease N-terminal domain-containing protein [Mycetocola zhujimingii]|uniref:Cardiolipin synthase N-terminal domain-containing protein n=1 Tax=Mycetocola zhujimingii TaxID=2079792 RepID=A0A2U1TAA2_9MICO|nr:PLD nuclease N-terminal domain-containing protein [Mycetocola zhujimingii]AWB85477.1 hypothetical protein C3E77_01735 [Mycetocola zhujimingii]PWC04614.1 hypothetical protein DF223_14295 [Mycetocola zhujimingii]